MFIDSLSALPALAETTNFSIFAVEKTEVEPLLERAWKLRNFTLSPDPKTGKISIEMVRDFAALTDTKDQKDRFFIVFSAETMTPAAQNAFLKNLEEPSPRHHFVLITKTPSALLETVLSRAQIFYLKTPGTLEQPVAADEKIKTLAKTLITADPKTLISLANDLAKHKDNPRAFALDVVGTAIELTYKTYFSSGEPKFLKKLKNLLTLYDNLAKNGHVKLHIVADML